MSLLIVAIASIILWGTVSRKLTKSSEEQNQGKNRGKIITLISAGTLSTIMLTISLFQNIQF